MKERGVNSIAEKRLYFNSSTVTDSSMRLSDVR
jgi:hypothetical protein